MGSMSSTRAGLKRENEIEVVVTDGESGNADVPEASSRMQNATDKKATVLKLNFEKVFAWQKVFLCVCV